MLRKSRAFSKNAERWRSLEADHVSLFLMRSCTQHYCWLVLWNMSGLWLSIYWEEYNPNWQTHIFQRGRYTTNQYYYADLHVWDMLGIALASSLPAEKHHPHQRTLLQPPHCDLSRYLHHVFTCKQGKEDPQPFRQASFGSKRRRCRILAFTCGLHTRHMRRHWKLITVIICVPWYLTYF